MEPALRSRPHQRLNDAILRVLRRVPGGPGLERAVRMRRFTRGLRRLNRVLDASPMRGRYWVWGGLLLGWARQGGVLPHDVGDADFAFEAGDRERFLASVPSVIGGGFRPLFRYRNHDGHVTQWVFFRAGSNFEFFELEPVADEWRYFGYFDFDVDEPIEIEARIPRQELEPFQLLGRRWLKARDHDRDLTALYGDWRTPQTDWRTDRDSPAVVSRRVWHRPPYRWDGDTTD